MSKKKTMPGTLDTSFAENGVLPLPLQQIPNARAVAILALPDNKLLYVGYFNDDSLVAVRLKEDGSLDSGFGEQQGYVELPLELTWREVLYGVSPLADGGWLTLVSFQQLGNRGLLIIRQRENGELETSFDGDGKCFLSYESFAFEQKDGGQSSVADHYVESTEAAPSVIRDARSCAVQDENGRFVVLLDGINPHAAVARLKSDGTYDESFNGGHVVVRLENATEGSFGDGVAVQGDRVLVCGNYQRIGHGEAFVTRFTAQGTVDYEFNNGAPVVIHNTAVGRIVFESLVVSKSANGDIKNDRIVGVGRAQMGSLLKAFIVVLTGSGSFNLVFNGGRPLYSDFLPQGLLWRRCAVDNNGAITVAGNAGQAVNQDMYAVTARFLAGGELDTSFNGKGWNIFDGDGTKSEKMEDMTVMKDGRIVVSGSFLPVGGPVRGWMVRYLG